MFQTRALKMGAWKGFDVLLSFFFFGEIQYFFFFFGFYLFSFIWAYYIESARYTERNTGQRILMLLRWY